MKKYIISLSFLLFTFVIFAQETGSISGTVTDKETRKAISNAEVLIIETVQGSVTSESGIFEIKNIKPGVYTVQSHALGYANNTLLNIKVKAGKNTQINFLMKTEDIELAINHPKLLQEFIIPLQRESSGSRVKEEYKILFYLTEELP